MSDKELVLRDSGMHEGVVDAILKERKGHIKFDVQKQAEFLAMYAQKGLKGKCAHAVGVSVDTVRRHQNDDPIFALALAEATAIYEDSIRQTVHNRAIEGWDEAVWYQGVQVGYVRKFSDRLLELHAKARVPEYRDKVDINVSGGVLVVGAALTQEQWTEQFKGMEAAKPAPKPVENLAK